MPLLQQFQPTGGLIEPDPAEPGLVDLYAHEPGRVRVNMVSTLDGASTGADGDSGSINNAADMRVFRVIRSVADVVVVGASTARRESYARRTLPDELAAARAARGQGPLALAVVTRSGNLPDDVLDSPGVVVVTTADSPSLAGLRARLGDAVIVAGSTDVDLRVAVADLADRGLTRVLCEGGPRLLGQMFTAGLVDELCLTTVPTVVGGPARRIVDANWLDPAPDLRLAHLLTADGTLIARWLVERG